MTEDYHDYDKAEMTLHKAAQLAYHLSKQGYHAEAATAMLIGGNYYLEASDE